MARGEGGGSALQHFAHGVELPDFLLVHRGDDQSAAGLVRDEAFVLDALERFAHGGAAHFELVGDFHFAQPVAGREHAGQDAALDLVVGREGLRIALGNGQGCLDAFFVYFCIQKIDRQSGP